MSAIRRHPLITFFVLTYAISWGFLPFEAVGFVAGGPFLAALIAVLVTVWHVPTFVLEAGLQPSFILGGVLATLAVTFW